MRKGQQRGYILVPAIFMLALLAVLTYLINTDSIANLNLTKQQAQTDRARYIAEAGLAHAEWVANNKTCGSYSLAYTQFQAGSYSATFVPNAGSPVSISAVGALANGATHTLTHDSVKVYDVATPQTLILQPGAESKDTFIEGESGHTGHNKGNDNGLKTSSLIGKEYRTLLQFDLSALPASATVQTATLELYLQNFGSTDMVKAHRLVRDWTEDGATWDDYDGTNSWNTPGGDYDPEVAGSFLANGTGPKSMGITAAAQAWVSGSQPNYGLILLSDPSPSGNENKYHSSDNASEPHPKLTLTYFCECGTSCASTPPPSCEADYTPMSKVGEFSSATLGAEDVQAITYIPEGTLFNGVSAPADGAWILIDTFDDLFYMTDMAGTLLTTLAVPVADVSGGVYVSAGIHADELALTSTSSVVFVDMSGNIVSALATSDFGIGQPAGIGFVGVSNSGTYDGTLLVLDRTSEIVTVINQAGTELGTIDVNDGLGASFVQDVKHLPGSDKLLVTYDCCKNAVYDFSGTKLREYDLEGFGATVSQASAIQPLSCEHVVAEGGADTLMYLSADAPSPYVETYQTWGASVSDAWETKELGALGVPPDAVVEVAVVNSNPDRQRKGGVRAVGSALDRKLNLHEAEEGGNDLVVMHVQADASASIEHNAKNKDDVSFILLGYWSTGTYVEAWDQFSAGASASWLDRSLAGFGTGPGQVAEIVIANRDPDNEYLAGVRTDGSTSQRRFDIHEAEAGGRDAITLLVGTGSDPNATVEVYAQSDSEIDFHLAGYWSDPPGNYVESADNSGTAVTAAVWEDVDLNAIAGVPAGAVVSVTLENAAAGAEQLMGVRETGSALARALDLQEAEGNGADLATLHVNADTSSNMQWYSELGGNHTFHISGWWVFP
ncbi:MAG: DNRLRE domain-containing protein [Pseudomonadales bacterium]